ncbi:response regulator transcription factor [Pseudoflavitalea sp. G-6-1-2]|uniref:LytR/AlgR family response regulator transcription factor n=1 Tax=Pseudoflavitalea sp. G-6-1-2 TaxID=2728841 RepID=UPI00146B41EE|nr:LytTR family DNA-binding domain-containing protein [Pseudoflavitalea sp. G-6-1-2]NML19533.1 response regulator transcription factor [Pseudoflavitalea sp. G-6-1-2]
MMQTDNPINCAILDDEPLPIELLQDYINKTPGLQLAYAFRDQLQLLQAIEKQPVQILFLDVQMPELTGFQVARLLNGKCEIIITTAFPQYALDGYEYDVADYLLKPFGFERFLVAINKCKKRLSGHPRTSDSEPTHFFVKTGSRLMKILHNDVFYLEAMRDYIGIHLANEKILTLQSLRSFEEQLPEKFIRIHRSYIINSDKVSYIEGNNISLGSTTLSVGEKYQQSLSKITLLRG